MNYKIKSNILCCWDINFIQHLLPKLWNLTFSFLFFSFLWLPLLLYLYCLHLLVFQMNALPALHNPLLILVLVLFSSMLGPVSGPTIASLVWLFLLLPLHVLGDSIIGLVLTVLGPRWWLLLGTIMLLLEYPNQLPVKKLRPLIVDWLVRYFTQFNCCCCPPTSLNFTSLFISFAFPFWILLLLFFFLEIVKYSSKRRYFVLEKEKALFLGFELRKKRKIFPAEPETRTESSRLKF